MIIEDWFAWNQRLTLLEANCYHQSIVRSKCYFRSAAKDKKMDQLKNRRGKWKYTNVFVILQVVKLKMQCSCNGKLRSINCEDLNYCFPLIIPCAMNIGQNHDRRGVSAFTHYPYMVGTQPRRSNPQKYVLLTLLQRYKRIMFCKKLFSRYIFHYFC